MSTLNNPARATGTGTPSPCTGEQVWHALDRCSFAVLGHVTPAGEPRSSGVVYTLVGHRMFVVVARDSWKARQVAANGRVAVTVPVRRGGLLSLLMPIPPATISFPATATVRAADDPEAGPVPARLARLLPPGSRTSSCLIEIRPVGHFVCYGIGVSLLKLRDTVLARARVPVS